MNHILKTDTHPKNWAIFYNVLQKDFGKGMISIRPVQDNFRIRVKPKYKKGYDLEIEVTDFYHAVLFCEFYAQNCSEFNA